MKIHHLISIFFLSFFPLDRSNAQFVGDIMFKEPSVAAAPGDIVTMEVVAFGGSEVFGAAHIDVGFDPEKLKIVEVKPGSAALQSIFATKLQLGHVGIIAVNDTSTTTPIGTVTLAKLRLQVLADPGTRTTLSIAPKGLLNAASDPFQKLAGFGAEIVVTSGTTLALNRQGFLQTSKVHAEPAPATFEQQQRALAVGRPGQAIMLMELRPNAGSYIAVPKKVIVGSGANIQRESNLEISKQ